MIRIYLVLLLIIVLYVAMRRLRKQSPEKLAKFMRITGLFVLITVLVLLGATGKLTWLLALIGVALAFISRMLPLLLRYAPDLQKLWMMFASTRQNQGRASYSAGAGGKMTVAEAYEVLGLKPGVSRQEIIKAHKRLMLKVHPDKGGTDFLAAKLNEAKAVLLKK